jgi:hypothetical protein
MGTEYSLDWLKEFQETDTAWSEGLIMSPEQAAQMLFQAVPELTEINAKLIFNGGAKKARTDIMIWEFRVKVEPYNRKYHMAPFFVHSTGYFCDIWGLAGREQGYYYSNGQKTQTPIYMS